MRRLDDSDSAPLTVRLPIAERAALVGELALTNETIETEKWLELTSRVTASQTVRLALRMFWADWQSCAEQMRAYFAARVSSTASSWVQSRLLFAILSNESSGFAYRVGKQSDKFSKDKKARPMVYCGWRQHEKPGFSVAWGIVRANAGESFTFEQLMRIMYCGNLQLRVKDGIFYLLMTEFPEQSRVFGLCP